MSNNKILFLSDEEVGKLMEWRGLVDYVEKGLVELSATDSKYTPPRLILETKVNNNPVKFYSMPAYCAWHNILASKVKTESPENLKRFNKKTTSGVVLLYSPNDGEILAILQTAVITMWRTAATSIVAAKYLFRLTKENVKDKTIAILGSGRQGNYHIRSFQEIFGFKTVNLWNHNPANAVALAAQLKKDGIEVTVVKDIKNCIKDADVVVVAAFSKKPLFEPEDLKPSAQVISLGENHSCPNVVYQGPIFTESVPCMLHEDQEIIREFNYDPKNIEYLGKVITGEKVPDTDRRLIFSSLGSAIVDAAAGRFVLDQLAKRSKL